MSKHHEHSADGDDYGFTGMWVRPARPGLGMPEYVHEDKDCKTLKRHPHIATPYEIENLDVCPHCSGEVEQPSESDFGPLNALKEAAQ